MPKKSRAVYNIAEAKARLPELVERATQGEEIVLARHGKARARLVPLVKAKPRFVAGAGKGRWGVPDIDGLASQPLDRAVVDAFYAKPKKRGS